jgi:hypothetical protein
MCRHRSRGSAAAACCQPRTATCGKPAANAQSKEEIPAGTAQLSELRSQTQGCARHSSCAGAAAAGGHPTRQCCSSVNNKHTAQNRAQRYVKDRRRCAAHAAASVAQRRQRWRTITCQVASPLYVQEVQVPAAGANLVRLQLFTCVTSSCHYPQPDVRCSTIAADQQQRRACSKALALLIARHIAVSPTYVASLAAAKC